MSLPNDPLELAILLHKQLQQIGVHERCVTGCVPPELDFTEVEAALEAADLLGAPNTHPRKVEFSLPANFFRSLDELLEAPSRRVEPLTRFYLADGDCLYTGNMAGLTQAVRNYLAATKLYTLLGKTADHLGGVGAAKTLIFLHKGKIELTPDYASDDLRELPDVATFQADFIESETHKEQKQTIVKTVLLEMFAGKNRVPFAELLNRFTDFVEKTRASYQLYVAEFSFQKVKAEVEKEKLDAMVKLNKVFSDIQSQLLAVPVALVLVGGQMEEKGAWVSKNVLVWLGALVFAILMDMLIRNQRHTLKAVKHEIDQQRRQIESKYQAVASRFEAAYREIDERHIHQQRLISTVDLLVAGCLLITTGLLLIYSGALSFIP